MDVSGLTSASKPQDGKSPGPVSQTPPVAESSPDSDQTFTSSPMSKIWKVPRKSTSSPEDSPAKTSPKQEPEQVSPEHALDSGSRWLTPFARFDLDSSSSKTSPDSTPRLAPVQESLLSEQSSLTWPKQGTWDLGFVYELPPSELPTSEKGSSFWLPTPAAYDDGKSPEQHLEMKARLPGGPRSQITSLTVLAKAGFEQPLLPTPGANDSTGGEGKTRAERQKRGKTGGNSLRDIGSFLPTPTVNDAKNTGGPSQRKRNSLPLTEIARDAMKLLPTPTAQDAESSGSRNLPGSKAHSGVSLTDAVRTGDSKTPRKLLPTPTATEAHRGARGRGSVARGGGESLVKAVQSGDSTKPPSDDGSTSSDDQHQDQLTIEDA